jgi:hypothetical protein
MEPVSDLVEFNLPKRTDSFKAKNLNGDSPYFFNAYKSNIYGVLSPLLPFFESLLL